MATYADYANRYDRIRAFALRLGNQINLLSNEVSRGAKLGPPDNIGSRISALDSQIDSSIDQLNDLADEISSSGLSQQQQDQLLNAIDATGNSLLDNQSRLQRLSNQAQDNERVKPAQETQKDSAGEIVNNESDARAENASTQNPPLPPETPPAATSTNAEQPETSNNTDLGNESGSVSTVGGSAPTKTIEQTQTPPGGTVLEIVYPNDDAVDSKRSSTATSTGGSGRPDIAKEFLAPIVAKENILSLLSTYTYSVSIYLMSPEEFSQLIAAQQKILPSKQLLIQSAGAPVGERNQWFNLDFYIEDLRIESVVGTQGSGSVHNALTLEFRIVEPNGITFLNRLNNAVIEHIGTSQSNINAFSQMYLMVIRFYGYDQNGLPVTGAQIGNRDQLTDQNSVVEKFIPFTITNFKYKIDSKATEYSISAAAPNTNVAFSTERASIPFNLRLVAPDVQTLLNGNLLIADASDAAFSSEQEAAFADLENNNPGPQALKGATITQGLAEALNEHQRRLVAAGSYEIADQYEIVLENVSGLRDAKMAKPGRPDKKQAGGNSPQTAADLFLSNKTQFDKDTKTYNVTAGTQIVQLIDLVMRTSSYVTSQQNVIFDEKTGEISGKTSNVQVVQWYRVRTQVVPIGYDSKRETIAFKIKYTISRYAINTPRSPYYPPAEYRGVHKLYNYWFTGENTEVLDFSIDVNNNYFVVIGNDGFVDQTPQGRFPAKKAYQSAPGGSLQGGTRGSSIPAANLSDRLYSSADVATGEVTIVGDPDWLQQSEVFYNRAIDLNPFMPDGSVNYDASEVLFELRFNPVVDYDLATGLTPVYENNIVSDSKTGEVNIPRENIVWSATTVTSMFQDGKFTQQLNGVYRDFAASTNAVSGDGRVSFDVDEDAPVGRNDPIQSGARPEVDRDDYLLGDPSLAPADGGGGLQPWALSNPSMNTPKSATVPNRALRLQSNGTRVNFNIQSAIDAGLPYRDTQIDGETVRVYGSERDLTQYIGPQAVPPKPGSGENAVDSDAGDIVRVKGIWT
jgi:hypothetical protein